MDICIDTPTGPLDANDLPSTDLHAPGTGYERRFDPTPAGTCRCDEARYEPWYRPGSDRICELLGYPVAG